MTPTEITRKLNPGYMSPNCMFSMIMANPEIAKQIIETEAYGIDSESANIGLSEEEGLELAIIGITYFEAYQTIIKQIGSQFGGTKKHTREYLLRKMRKELYRQLPAAERKMLSQCEQAYIEDLKLKRGED